MISIKTDIGLWANFCEAIRPVWCLITGVCSWDFDSLASSSASTLRPCLHAFCTMIPNLFLISWSLLSTSLLFLIFLLLLFLYHRLLLLLFLLIIIISSNFVIFLGADVQYYPSSIDILLPILEITINSSYIYLTCTKIPELNQVLYVYLTYIE